MQIVSRRSYAQAANSGFDYPLSTRFDETDSLVVFNDVFVPWEHVFVYRDLDLVQAQWWETPAWCSATTRRRSASGPSSTSSPALAQRVTAMNGVDGLPPVQGTLGELAAQATLFNGLVLGAEQNCMLDEHGCAPGQARPRLSPP